MWMSMTMRALLNPSSSVDTTRLSASGSSRPSSAWRVLRENRRKASRRIRIRHFFNRVGSPQRLAEEETQRSLYGARLCAHSAFCPISILFNFQLTGIRTCNIIGKLQHSRTQGNIHAHHRQSPTLPPLRSDAIARPVARWKGKAPAIRGQPRHSQRRAVRWHRCPGFRHR